MSGDLVTKLASIVIEGRRSMEEVALSVASAMDGTGDLAELRGLLTEEELGQLQGGPTGFDTYSWQYFLLKSNWGNKRYLQEVVLNLRLR